MYKRQVFEAIKIEPDIPNRLKKVINKKEKFVELENNEELLINFIRENTNV